MKEGGNRRGFREWLMDCSCSFSQRRSRFRQMIPEE